LEGLEWSGNININVEKVNDIGSVETEPKIGGIGGWKAWISKWGLKTKK